MKRFKVAVRPRPSDITGVAKLAGLLALALIVPSIGLDQQFTGPMVNALLLISAVVVGLPGAIMVGALPSLVALARGTLPLPMAVMVPYIIFGNAALVGVFYLLHRRNYWLALVPAAIVKFGLLFFAVTYMVTVPPALAGMMQWPQLYTALLGGVIAWVVLGIGRLRLNR
ncbi:MAG: ECF transporter S component [Chloroflexota bacterium]